MQMPDPSLDSVETGLTDALLIFLDTETTGLDHKTEKIIEIGAVKTLNGEVVDTFSTLVNPEKPIRYSSFLVHGITDEQVQDAPPMSEVLPKLLEFVGDLPFVAHNAIFDYSFVNEAMKSLMEQRFSNHRIDTFDMYRCVFPDDPSHGLSSLLARFGFDPEVKHRALDDAMALAKVYPQLSELYYQKQRWQVSQLQNVPYLVERYLRLQKAIQILQGEMSDLKEVFKLHFQQGGKPVTASTGETMVSNYRRSYEYDLPKIFQLLKDAELLERAYKLNPRFVDKLIDRSTPEDELRSQLIESRTLMTESRQVNFVKPTTSGSAESEPAATEETEGPSL